MRILVVGEGKSGTTALMQSLRAAVPEAAESFEPTHLGDVPRSGPLVAKKLLAAWSPDEAPLLSNFDHVIYIVRDPRDRLISHLLYDSYNRGAKLTDSQSERWLTALSRKVANPLNQPLIRLMDIWWQMTDADLMQGYIRTLWRTSLFRRRYRDDVTMFRYEDLVADRFDDLNNALGLELARANVDGPEERVLRSGSDGDWRHWFTPIDVNAFRPSTTKWLRRHGYAHRDWELADPPQIHAEQTTEYVDRLLTGVRASAATLND